MNKLTLEDLNDGWTTITLTRQQWHDLVAEIIGRDDHMHPTRPNLAHRGLIKHRNELRAEQRKRAGLDT
jgi:hypothetical protein